MCNFVSFFIVGTKNGLAVIPTDNLCEHSERSYLNSLTGIGAVCEAEWTSPDPKDLSVRLPSDQKDSIQRDWFLKNYPSRAALIKSFCGMFENKINGDITLTAGEKDLDWLNGLSVGGSLDLSGTQITKLPDGLSVGGSLYLSGTQITKLPDGLSVGGSLYLSGTQITKLPDGLSVGGSLYLSGTQITKLPDGLSVGGSLDLSGTQITKLPDGLSVGGSLDLSGTQITKLPDGLSVGGSLYLSGTQITKLPDGLSVGGSLDLRNTQITKPDLPKHLRSKAIF